MKGMSGVKSESDLIGAGDYCRREDRGREIAWGKKVVEKVGRKHRM